MPQPKCPFCKSRDIEGSNPFLCRKCRAMFDNDPNEGGDYGHRPDQRMIWQERKPRKTDLRGGL